MPVPGGLERSKYHVIKGLGLHRGIITILMVKGVSGLGASGFRPGFVVQIAWRGGFGAGI
jgi:hypothetical protein